MGSRGRGGGLFIREHIKYESIYSKVCLPKTQSNSRVLQCYSWDNNNSLISNYFSQTGDSDAIHLLAWPSSRPGRPPGTRSLSPPAEDTVIRLPSRGPSRPTKNRCLGHPKALSGRPHPRETSSDKTPQRNRGRARGGPGRPRGRSEPASLGGPAQAGARRRRPGARGLPGGGGGRRCPGPTAAPPPPARRGPPVCLGPRGRRNPPLSAVPAAGAWARRGPLSLTLRGRGRIPERRGGAGSTARAASSKWPPPPQYLRCRRAARQETGGFGAGRPRHVPASGPAVPGDRPLKGTGVAASAPARSPARSDVWTSAVS
ncbi:collagen alpha-1(I) chain-like [Orcinus orca]|uniref:collagen alpha-1(I) chain-like n=1 Tax=Orcinus orca TaxID=9733 RepID=UPI0021138089|nr:collagen alpha-1(I) chain-like [Orcinus orca]